MTVTTAEMITAHELETRKRGALDSGKFTVEGSGNLSQPRLDQYLDLAALIEAAGYGTSDEIRHLSELHDTAFESTRQTAASVFAGINPATLTPDEVRARMRGAILSASLASQPGTGHATIAYNAFSEALRPAVEVAFTRFADEAVTAMGSDFTKALAVVAKAKKAGIEQGTTPEQIATTAPPAQVTAFRDLTPAVGKLNQLADLRVRIHHLIDWQAETGAAYVPVVHTTMHEDGMPVTEHRYVAGRDDSRVMAAFLDEPDAEHRAGAANVYTGQTETVFTQAHPSAGPTASRAPRQRVGGPWLALLDAGYTPTLRTPTQTAATLAASENA